MTASGKKISLVLCAMLLLTGMVAISHAAQPVSPDLDLEHKRTKLAMRWLEPEPHMALAKLISDRRDRLLAFYILENIRRTGFPKEVFDQAFDQVFRERDAFDNSPEAEAVALAA